MSGTDLESASPVVFGVDDTEHVRCPERDPLLHDGDGTPGAVFCHLGGPGQTFDRNDERSRVLRIVQTALMVAVLLIGFSVLLVGVVAMGMGASGS